MNTTHTSSDDRDIHTLKRVAAFSCAIGAAIAALVWFNPPDAIVDPASTPAVQAEIAACVAAKPEIEAAARGRGVMFDWNGVLENRIAAVNAHDPNQCGAMLDSMRKSRREAETMAMYGMAI